MDDNDLTQKVDALIAAFGEFIEDGAVQVLLSWNSEGKTRRYYSGSGNWYARQGMAHEFITMDEAQEHAKQIADELKKD